MTHQRIGKMKITESRLNKIISECFDEVMKESLAERNAEEIGMTDDEVIARRIARTKQDFKDRHMCGNQSFDRATEKYVDSFPDKDWDWHRLLKHDFTNNHLRGHDGGDVKDRYEKRYNEKIDDDERIVPSKNEAATLQEGMNNNPSYTHYLLNRMTNKIVNGWDYNGTDPADIKYYTKIDLDDMGFSTKDYKFLTKQSVLKLGINPDDDSTWANS